MRPDERRAVPGLLLRRLLEAAASASRADSPGGAGAFVAYARRSGPAAASSGAISRVRGGQRPGEARGARWRSSTTAPPARGTSGPRSGARRGSPAPRGSPAAGRCAAGAPGRTSRAPDVGRRPLAGQPVERLPAERRRPRDEQHLLGGEQDRPEHAGQPCRAARDAVDADPLPGAAGAGPDERDLDGSRASAGSPADAGLDPGELLAPADELALRGRAVRAAPGEEDDRLEEARLAGGVRAPHELRARARRPRRARGSPAGRGSRGRAGSGRRTPTRGARRTGARVRDPLRQDVVRTGITTCT